MGPDPVDHLLADVFLGATELGVGVGVFGRGDPEDFTGRILGLGQGAAVAAGAAFLGRGFTDRRDMTEIYAPRSTSTTRGRQARVVRCCPR